MTANDFTITATELIETRANQAPRMRFPVDPDTTRRLKLVIDGGEKLPLWRRVVRWARGIRS